MLGSLLHPAVLELADGKRLACPPMPWLS